MNDISKETLQKIKQQHITPRPRHYFMLKRSTIWGLFGLSIILGTIASGAAMFQLENAEWDLYQHLGHSLPEFLMLVIPYFWGLFLLGFSIVAYYYFRRTEKGYRYRTATVIALSVLLSVAGGWGIFASGFSERLEPLFEKTLPFYRGVEAHKREVWMSPDNGLLAGKVIKVLNEKQMRLEDLEGKLWLIDMADATWRGRLVPAASLEIKLIGNRTGKDSFAATEVRPWHGRKRRHTRHYTHAP